MKYLMMCVLLMLGGCAVDSNQYKVVYQTVPSKAMLTCGGVSLGYTPVTLYYTKQAIQVAPQGANCSFTWISGYVSAAVPITVEAVMQYPHGVSVNGVRPNDGPGYQVDAQAAFYAEQNKPKMDPNWGYQNKTPTNTYCNKVAGQVMCTSY